MITAYTVAFGALLVPCGRVVDLVGARRAFRWGVTVFVVSSAVCALAWTPGVLIAARAVQGVGSALLSPAALPAGHRLSGVRLDVPGAVAATATTGLLVRASPAPASTASARS